MTDPAQTFVVNNWLSSQWCTVTLVSTAGDDGIVQWPDGRKTIVPLWDLEASPQPGFREWNGEGAWAS